MREVRLLTGLVTLMLFVGCESADVNGNFWQQKEEKSGSAAAETTGTDTASKTTGTDTASNGSSDETSTAGDGAPFAAFRFIYGNFKGEGAKLSSPRISSLRFTSNDLYYKWAGSTLASWGMSDGQADAICCLFVQNNEGQWVGGKFDWISTSRTHRDLNHVTRDGYGGWNLRGVPNPCKAAFVIISRDSRRRSNVIAATWQR